MLSKFKNMSLMNKLLVFLFILPDTAFASMAQSGNHESPSIVTLLWPTVNFLIFFFLCVHFYKKLARPVLRDYRIELESAAVRQQNEHSTLSSEFEQIKERLTEVSEEKKEIISELERDGRDLSAVILSSSNQQAERLSNQAKHRFALEAQKISGEAKKVLLNRVMQKVSDQLSGTFSAEDDASFIKKTIDSDLEKIFGR
jgi:F0F1-type ATP synthase membrane subunit b/b'